MVLYDRGISEKKPLTGINSLAPNIVIVSTITRIVAHFKRRDAGAGRTGLTRNQVYPLGTVGSNPTLSAT